MNTGYKFAAWTGGASLVFFALAGLDALTGIVGWLAPTEAHAFGLLVIAVPCVMIVRSYLQSAISLPNVRRMAAPRQTYRRYARRTEGMQ